MQLDKKDKEHILSKLESMLEGADLAARRTAIQAIGMIYPKKLEEDLRRFKQYAENSGQHSHAAS